VTDPVELVTQRATERVIDLVVNAMDINALVAQVDLDGILTQVDVDALLNRVDVNALLDRVDVNALLDRWVRRLLRRKRPGPSAPPTLLAARAES
jgi:hypothetical protein